MAHGRSDDEIVRTTHNTARFFTETRHVSWVLLVFTVAWGVYGYVSMPRRKDPDIPIRDALIVCPWPGASALRIEPLVTRRIEEKIAENARVERVLSNTRSSVAVVQVRLQKGVGDVGKEFDDIKLKLDSIHDLPPGAGPIHFVKDFGDTGTLLLTVASPRITEVEIALRARFDPRGPGAEPPSGGSRPAGRHRVRLPPVDLSEDRPPALRDVRPLRRAEGSRPGRRGLRGAGLRRPRRGLHLGRSAPPRAGRRVREGAAEGVGAAPRHLEGSHDPRPARDRGEGRRLGRRQVQLPRAQGLHRQEGEPLEQALLDAGIMRLRPVLITVGATVIALFPLAAHGGPLWEPLCYAQIGGLTVATVVTLLLVPVLYAIFVRDLRLVSWER